MNSFNFDFCFFHSTEGKCRAFEHSSLSLWESVLVQMGERKIICQFNNNSIIFWVAFLFLFFALLRLSFRCGCHLMGDENSFARYHHNNFIAPHYFTTQMQTYIFRQIMWALDFLRWAKEKKMEKRRAEMEMKNSRKMAWFVLACNRTKVKWSEFRPRGIVECVCVCGTWRRYTRRWSLYIP